MTHPDLRTTYLGLDLKNPLVAFASPLSKHIDTVRRLEDAGAAALVMYSLFEEQITHESYELDHYLSRGTETYAEALSYFPDLDHYNIRPEAYLKHLARVKDVVDILRDRKLKRDFGGWMDRLCTEDRAGWCRCSGIFQSLLSTRSRSGDARSRFQS